MKIILFDLKGTLIDEKCVIRPGVQNTLKNILKREDVQTIAYSMNEPWTYSALSANPLLARIDKVILVRKKRLADVAQIQGSKDTILVVGDGVNEELLFAKELSIKSYDATNRFPAGDITEWLEKDDG